jgi:hypothetical protein
MPRGQLASIAAMMLNHALASATGAGAATHALSSFMNHVGVKSMP